MQMRRIMTRGIPVGSKRLGIFRAWAWTGSARRQDVAIPPASSARKLLESPELVDVAVDQLFAAAGGALGPGDTAMVRDVVAAGFGNISLALTHRSPKAAQQLDSFQLTEEQRRAVLQVVGRMGDPRVRAVGAELADSLRAFVSSSPWDRESMKREIQQSMQPHLPEICQLRDEVIPAVLQQQPSHAGGVAATWRGGRVALDPERMRVVHTFDGHWKFEFEMSRPRPLNDREFETGPRRLAADGAGASAKSFGVAGGVAEQARAVLVQLRTILKKFGIDMEVPQWITSLDGKMEPFLSEILNCAMNAQGDEAKLISCPMKFGSAGMDVFAALQGASPGRVVGAHPFLHTLVAHAEHESDALLSKSHEWAHKFLHR